MISQSFDILAAVLALVGAINYAWVTFLGKAQPNRVSWLLWTITPSISFAVELAQHVHLEVTLLTLSEAIGPFLVVAASLTNAKAFWKANVFDWMCGGIAVLAIILWLTTKQGDIALIFSLAASLFSAIPTIIKSYAHPTSESPWDYLASLVAGIITLLTIQHWTLGNYGFPVYITLESFVIAFFVLTPKRVHEQAALANPNAIEIPITQPNIGEAGNVVDSAATDTIVQHSSTATPANDIITITPSTNASAPSSNENTATSAPAVSNRATWVLGTPTWSHNPIPQGESTVLSVSIESPKEVIARVEYIGAVDPGLDKGFPMLIQDTMATVTFAATVPKGTYAIRVRAIGANNDWVLLEAPDLEIV